MLTFLLAYKLPYTKSIVVDIYNISIINMITIYDSLIIIEGWHALLYVYI